MGPVASMTSLRHHPRPVVVVASADESLCSRLRDGLCRAHVIVVGVGPGPGFDDALTALAPCVVLVVAHGNPKISENALVGARRSGATVLVLAPHGLDDAVVGLLRSGAADYVPMERIDAELAPRIDLAVRPVDARRASRRGLAAARALRALPGPGVDATATRRGEVPSAEDLELVRLLVQVAARSR